MRRSRALLTAVLVAMVTATGASAQSPAAPSPNTPVIAIETEVGTIRVELDPQHAPATVANFLRYVNEHFFDGTAFYRAVTPDNQPTNPIKIDVIQGGANDSKQTYPPDRAERIVRHRIKHTWTGLILDGAQRARTPPRASSSSVSGISRRSISEGGLRNPDGRGFAAFGQRRRRDGHRAAASSMRRSKARC